MKKSNGNDRTRSPAPLTKETVVGHNRIPKKPAPAGSNLSACYRLHLLRKIVLPIRLKAKVLGINAID